MKVGIITFHFVNNFGGALQAYALRRVVAEQCNAEAEIIDYKNWFIRLTDSIRMLPITRNFQELKSGLKTMEMRFERKKKFNLFINKNIKLTRKYSSHLSLSINPPSDDKYICGSDQIWNPFLTMGVSSNYYLKFESDPKNKISYAPSFGTDGIL